MHSTAPIETSSSGASLLTEAESLLARRNLCAAIESFHQAELHGANPDRCASGRWIAHMLQSHFSAAWNESDAIRRRGTAGPHSLWQGEEINGKRVIVRCLHGFGDAVQFLRYAPRLRESAAKVIWEVPPALLELAPYFCGVDDVATWGRSERAKSFQWQVQLEIMELPYLFRTHLAELPIATKYLHLPRRIIRSIAPQMGLPMLPRIGVVWAAGEWNPSRSIPLALLRPLLRRSDCEFWNLQGGSRRNEWRDLRNCVSLRDAKACDSGILSLAGIISQLDLVLTVDTLTAHLAGALGIPAWLMLQYAADWRWMVNRNDSLWYPSLRLFRQSSPGDWATVASSVEEALCDWLQSHDRRLIA
jgi:hypothetical protein